MTTRDRAVQRFLWSLRRMTPWSDPGLNAPRALRILVQTAAVGQALSDTQMVVAIRRAEERDHRHGHAEGKLFLLWRVMFELPEDRWVESPADAKWVTSALGAGPPPWSAAWPVAWRPTGPFIATLHVASRHRRYDSAAEYLYLRNHFSFRDLSVP